MSQQQPKGGKPAKLKLAQKRKPLWVIRRDIRRLQALKESPLGDGGPAARDYALGLGMFLIARKISKVAP